MTARQEPAIARLEAENERLRALIADLRAERVALRDALRQEAKRC